MLELYFFAKHLVRLLIFVRGVLAALLSAVLICSGLLMEFEGLPFGESLYFSAITTLTVGYGDVTPKTPAGRVVCVAVAFIGVVFTGLIVAVATRALVHAVEDERKFRAAKKERRATRRACAEGNPFAPHAD